MAARCSALQGTAPDIFEQIEASPDYQPQLDTRIMPGTKHVPRWVHLLGTAPVPLNDVAFS